MMVVREVEGDGGGRERSREVAWPEVSREAMVCVFSYVSNSDINNL